MSKKAKKEKEKEEEEVKETPFDSMAYNELFVVKNKPGIYLILSMPNKSDLVGIRAWEDIMDPNRISTTTHRQNLTLLGSLVFYDKKGEVFPLQTVFNNLYNYEETLEGDTGIEDFDLNDPKTVENLMKIAIPNYDEDKFKPYHLLKVVKYYTWAKQSIAKIFEITSNFK